MIALLLGCRDPEPPAGAEPYDVWFDGRALHLLRDGTPVLVLPIEGPGEAVEVASSREAITNLDWSPDGERLAWVTRVPAVEHGTKDRDREPRRIDTLLTRLDDVGWVVDRPQHVFVGRADSTEDRKSTRLNSSHLKLSRMPSSA